MAEPADAVSEVSSALAGATANVELPGLERVLTGIVGLDQVLRGGLVGGGAYLVAGRPGTGKTTFGNHLAHAHARAGGVVVFATVLAETHGRMLAHLRGYQFLAPELIGHRIHYVSVYDELTENGLQGVLTLFRRLVRERQATLLVVDGAGLLEDLAATQMEYRRFTQELQSHLDALGCTSLLLANRGPDDTHMVGTHLDGILLLANDQVGARDIRSLRVAKLRGAAHLGGRHEFAITEAGIEVYPRLESLPPRTAGPALVSERLRFGVEALDGMLGGGLLPGSNTLVLGSPGTGKTLLGLHFVAEGARRGERGMLVGFQEAPSRLVEKAEAVGLDLGRHVSEGTVQIMWDPPVEMPIDAWAQRLFAEVDTHHPRRFFLDSLNDVQRLMIEPERLFPFITALTNALRAAGATSLLSVEAGMILGPELTVPIPAAATTADNAMLLRYVELRSQLHRLISIIKVREGAYDTAIREFQIGDQGIEVASTFKSAEAVLTGVARHVAAGDPGGRGGR